VSAYVVQEIKDGDPLRATRRLREVQHLNQFAASNKLIGASELLVLGGGLSGKARKASEHIVCAAMNHCDILLTWNCRDIANAEKLPLIRMLMQIAEYEPPELVTPFEIMENHHEDL
jgi:hypothetical protein